MENPTRALRRRPRVVLAALAAVVAVVLLVVILGRSPTAPQAQEPRAVVWAVGDAADGSPGSIALAALITSAPSDRFLYLGDVYARGTASEFRDNYASVFGRLAPKTAPTPGNHEWPNHATGYDPYWTRVHGRRQPAYYSFSVAGWRIFSLNSEASHGAGSAQLRWVKDRLGRGNCRIAFWHRPRFSAGRVHGDQPDMDALWRALRGHATLVLSGHDHNSQRFKPRDGIVQLVAGAGRGGEPLYPLRRDARLAFGDARELAALRLTLTPGRARFAFVGADGSRLNVGEVPCRA